MLAYLITSFTSNRADTCKEKYLSFILENGFSYRSYYLNIYVQDSTKKKYSVVVTSYDLYEVLNKETGIDRTGYIAVVKKSLKEHKPIDLAKQIQEYKYFLK